MPAPPVVFEGRRFKVERRERGGRADYDVVIHPGAAVILPVLDDGRIVLIRNQRVAVGRELLELPAGTLDQGEQLQDCARRELEEETGYRSENVEPLMSFYSSPGITNERMHVFIATKLKSGEQRLDDGEQIRLAPQSLEAALAAVRGGDIQDAKTIAALLYYDRFVRSASAR